MTRPAGCPVWSERLLDAASEGVVSRELREHLDRCASCAAEWKALSEARAFVTAAPEIELPEGFDARFFSKLVKERAEARKWVWFPWLRPALITAFVLGGMLFAFQVHQRASVRNGDLEAAVELLAQIDEQDEKAETAPPTADLKEESDEELLRDLMNLMDGPESAGEVKT